MLDLPNVLYKEGRDGRGLPHGRRLSGGWIPEEEILDTYRLERGHVRMIYRMVGHRVDIAVIYPNI